MQRSRLLNDRDTCAVRRRIVPSAPANVQFTSIPPPLRVSYKGYSVVFDILVGRDSGVGTLRDCLGHSESPNFLRARQLGNALVSRVVQPSLLLISFQIIDLIDSRSRFLPTFRVLSHHSDPLSFNSMFTRAATRSFKPPFFQPTKASSPRFAAKAFSTSLPNMVKVGDPLPDVDVSFSVRSALSKALL